MPAPAVIPLQALGVIDVGATYVGDNEVLANAMANASNTTVQNSYGVRRGGVFVNEYPRTDTDGQRSIGETHDPHHTMGSYPWLWPYATGGIEVNRPINVPYQVHVQKLLQYPDKHFRLDPTFIFQAFGVLQKHQVCSSACLQVARKAFLKHQDAFRSLTPQYLVMASGEESWKVPFSNPVTVVNHSNEGYGYGRITD
jgi:hypothetical protein